MYFHVPLILFLLASTAPSDAALFSRDSDSSLARAARHVRRHVIKRSTGILDDLRLAYTGVRLQKRQQQHQQVLVQSSKMYCVVIRILLRYPDTVPVVSTRMTAFPALFISMRLADC